MVCKFCKWVRGQGRIYKSFLFDRGVWKWTKVNVNEFECFVWSYWGLGQGMYGLDNEEKKKKKSEGVWAKKKKRKERRAALRSFYEWEMKEEDGRDQRWPLPGKHAIVKSVCLCIARERRESNLSTNKVSIQTLFWARGPFVPIPGKHSSGRN